jgi:phosphoglycolate phosphatase-like HAD superfamily hydrolase
MKLLVFDSDGVLVNSWPEHHKFLCDMAEKYQPELTIPPLPESYCLVTNGMGNLVRRAGFNEELIERIIQVEYARFGTDYRPPLFAGVREMLEQLSSDRSVRLAIVSSNELRNVLQSLGDLASCFLPGNIITRGFFPNKNEALRYLIKENRVSVIKDVVFVGDTMGDLDESEKAGVPFFGSGYGWEIRAGNIRSPVATSVQDLHEMLLRYAV